MRHTTDCIPDISYICRYYSLHHYNTGKNEWVTFCVQGICVVSSSLRIQPLLEDFADAFALLHRAKT